MASFPFRVHLYDVKNHQSEIVSMIRYAFEIAQDIDEERIRAVAEKHGMLSMRKSGMDRIREGLTDITEVLYATSED